MKIEKILLFILIIILSFIFLNYFSIAISNLLYPYDVEQAESFMLPRIKFLLTGHPEYLYSNIYSYPYFVTNDYPPTFYFITTFMSWIFGDGFFAGRLLVFLSSLLIGIFIFKIVKMETRNNYFSLIAALFFFSSYVIFYWGSIYRVDIPGAMFSLVGIYFIFLYAKNVSYKNLFGLTNKYLIISIIFFILAVTTKQSYVLAPLASFFYLFIKDRKKSFQFALMFAIPAISIFLLLNFLTEGQFFFHTIVYNSRMLVSQNSTDLIINLVQLNFIILAISIIFFIKNRANLISIYFLLSLIFAFFQVFKTGSATNYFIEFVATTSIIVGISFNILYKKKILFSIFVLLLFLQLLVFSYFYNQVFLAVINPEKYFAIRNVNADMKILNYIKNAKGNVFIQHSLGIAANKDGAFFELWGIYDIPEGYVNTTRFEQYFKDQNYSLIFANRDFYVFKNLAAYVEKNYDRIDQIDWYDNDIKYFPLDVYKSKTSS